MRLALQYALWAAGLTLQVLVIHALQRKFYKRFPLVFVYTIALFLTTVAEVSVYTAARTGSRALAHSWRVYYWANDAFMQALIFAVVIALTRQAMEGSSVRWAIRRWLIAGGFLVFGLSFLIHSGPIKELSAWMTLVSRDLSFAAVVLDLLLWSTLIAARKKDRRLLMLSGGLGIQFTGEAIGQSIRQLAHGATRHSAGISLAGGVLVALSSVACLYVWWRTFRDPVASEAHPTT